MHIEVYTTHNQVVENSITSKLVVIIDVLRATSVIATALDNGAKKIMTTPSIEDALERKTSNPALLLGGERNAQKIKGFDFGNSPLEYTKVKVLDKALLLCTSNGTKAVNKALGANTIIAASFLNMNAIVNYLDKKNEDVVIICSGTNGNFSLDDGLCAGLIIHELRKRKEVDISDFAELLVLPFEKDAFSLGELLKNAFHLNYLKSKGYEADVNYCLKINHLNLIPVWDKNGFIVLKDS